MLFIITMFRFNYVFFHMLFVTTILITSTRMINICFGVGGGGGMADIDIHPIYLESKNH